MQEFLDAVARRLARDENIQSFALVTVDTDGQVSMTRSDKDVLSLIGALSVARAQAEAAFTLELKNGPAAS